MKNVKGKKFKYEELHELWEQTFPHTKMVFSMCEWDDETDEVIPEVNFLSKEPIVGGEYSLSFYTWVHDGMFTIKGIDLTWNSLLDILEIHNDDAHIFLEVIDIKENNQVFLFLGS